MTQRTEGVLWGILKGWWLILLLTAVGAGVAILLHMYVIPSQYKATATLYIMDQESGSVAGTNNYNDLLGGELIATDAKQIFASNAVLKQAAEALGYNNTGIFDDSLSITSGDSPRIILVTIESEDPQFAMNGVNAVVESFLEQAELYFPNNQFLIVDAAELPSGAENGVVIKNVLASSMSGFLLAILILMLWSWGKPPAPENGDDDSSGEDSKKLAAAKKPPVPKPFEGTPDWYTEQ